MPNIIPPIVSSSPPPIDPVGDDDNDEDDEFGDFAVADFSTHDDTVILKSGISDTSWKPPSPTLTSPKHSTKENGMSVYPSVSTPAPNQGGDMEVTDEDEEVFQHTDSISHDSVVSGGSGGSAVTDSGLCSTSQNSDIVSPMPQAEVGSELLRTHVTNITPTHVKVCEGEIFNGVKNDVECTHLGNNIQNVEVNSCISTAQLPSTMQDLVIDEPLSHARSDEVECDGGLDQLKQTDPLKALASNSPEVQSDLNMSCQEHELGLALDDDLDHSQIPGVGNTVPLAFGRTSPPSLELREYSQSGDDTDDEFGQWNSIDPVNLNVVNSSNEREQSAFACSGLDMMATKQEPSLCQYSGDNTDSKSDKSNRETSVEEDEFVGAMIVPDMPVDCDDDIIVNSASTLALEEEEFSEFDSASRRPTLVVSDKTELSADMKNSVSVVRTTEFSHDVDLEAEPSDIQNQALPADFCSEDNFNEFSSFECMPSAVEKCPPSENNGDIDEFADFDQGNVSFSKDTLSDGWAGASTSQSVSTLVEPSELDDFDDFESAEFQSAVPETTSQASGVTNIDYLKIQARVPDVLKELFPIVDESMNPSTGECAGGLSGVILDAEDSAVWQALRDLEATPSLSFQWPGSHANRGLLGALNIDSRNILFGPKWNTVVPRFAANLGFSPLEPVRAVQVQPQPEPVRQEQLQPQPVEHISKASSPSPSSSVFQETVPEAQFDWSDSGLVNPLDSNKSDQSGQSLATTATSGNPVMSSTPLQVEQLLANAKSTASSVHGGKNTRDPSLSQEAVKILDSLPELAFLSARMLMFPVQSDSSAHKL